MKVAHIFYEIKFSGAEIMYADAVPEFRRLDCELIVINTSENLGEYSAKYEGLGCLVLHLPYPKWYNVASLVTYWIKFISMLKRYGIDVVHIHTNHLKWIMSMLAWISGKRSVYTFHNVFKSNWYSYHYHVWLRWSAKKIFKCRFQTISNSVYDNELIYYKNDTRKIFNWYGNDRFFPSSSTEKLEVRNSLNLCKDSLVIISIGGCSSIKRHSDILYAMATILKTFPNSVYIHLGSGDTECQEIELAKELKIDHAVRFLGNKTDVRKYLIASDIYVMTSKFEGISITTIEALACGTPAVLYSVPGLKDFNADGYNSILIDEDPSVLAKKVIQICENPSEIQQVVKNGKAFVDNYFDLGKNVNQIYNLYQSK